MNKQILHFCIAIGLILLSQSCTNDDAVKQPNTQDTNAYSSYVVQSWIELTLKLTKETEGFTPPVAARVYGYSGLALYESVRPGMNGYKSLEGQITDFKIGTVPQIEEGQEYHWAAVANATLSTFLQQCFRTTTQDNLKRIYELEEQYNTRFSQQTSPEILNRSIEHGKAVAKAILKYTGSDGQAECHNQNFPNSYQVPIGEGFWVPTDKNTPIPLQPYWGKVRPFLQQNVDGTLPPPPPAYSTDKNSAFYKEALEVYEAANNLTEEQKTIAEFWSDDPVNTATPPGHSYSIMLQILQQEQANLALAAEVYAKLGMGIHDAFISCWNAKYHYNLVRPITFIHNHIDPNWSIALATPPFPEYTSGHSVQAGATAEILTNLFGDDYTFLDKTHMDRTDIDGRPRAFSSFYDFADEAAISRLYGGIHYRAAIDVGLEQGVQVGKNILTIEFK